VQLYFLFELAELKIIVEAAHSLIRAEMVTLKLFRL
jgi:hypothetical protein